MSLFLGKIHYLVFNKILWFEGIEDDLIDLCKKEGLDVPFLREKIFEKYGEKLPNKPLEEIIDHNNIHGWLQGNIVSSESRVAAWISELIKKDKETMHSIEEIYINQGIKAANEVKEGKDELKNAIEIYNSINNYILDGMPCDRVNEIIIYEEDLVRWKRRICVHSDIWQKVGVKVEYFYKLRGLWIKAFINNTSSNFEYIENEEGTIEIRKA